MNWQDLVDQLHLTQITPRQWVEIGAAVFVLLLLFNWWLRGRAIRKLKRRVRDLENPEFFVSEEEWEELNNRLGEFATRLDQRMSPLENMGDVASRTIEARLDQIRKDFDLRYGSSDEEEDEEPEFESDDAKLKRFLIEDMEWDDVDSIERVINAGKIPPPTPEPQRQESTEEMLVDILTSNPDLEIEDSETIGIILKKAREVDGGEISISTVEVVRKIAEGGFNISYVEEALDALKKVPRLQTFGQEGG